jgi:hypothetical protein
MAYETKYQLDLSDQNASQLAELIKEWRADDTALFSQAVDLLMSIEEWLRANAEDIDAVVFGV